MVPETALVIIFAIHSASRAEVLVTRLENPLFAAREAAARELVRLGDAAVPALGRGRSHRDAEVADRCGRLLPLARAEGHRQRMARLEAIVRTYPLPPIPSTERMLRRFVAVTGDTRAARQFYFDIYKEHSKALDEIEWADPKPAGRSFWGYVDRKLMYPDGRNNRSLDLSTLTFSRVDLALFWFLSADAEIRPAPCRGLGRKDCPYYFPKHAEGHLDGPEAIPEMRRLFVAWLASPRNVADSDADRRMVTTGFELASRSRQVELASAVRQIAIDRKLPRDNRVEAIFAIMRTGGIDDADRLARIITEDAIVYLPSPIQGPGRKVVVGDVALAACVRLAGWKLSDFGFPDAGEAEDEPTDVRHYGFADDDARTRARKKWAAQFAARTSGTGGKQ